MDLCSQARGETHPTLSTDEESGSSTSSCEENELTPGGGGSRGTGTAGGSPATAGENSAGNTGAQVWPLTQFYYVSFL